MALKNTTASIPTYDLYMQNDINTKGCTQWYYFSVTSRSRGKAKLRIINFVIFILFSISLLLYIKEEWKFYSPMTVLIGKGQALLLLTPKLTKIHILLTSFMIFNYPKKIHILPMDIPILIMSIICLLPTAFMLSPNFKSKQLFTFRIIHKAVLCTSLMGNPIHMLYISNFSQKKDPKQLIYIIGRQHPGETPASFIVEGVINFLLSNSH